MSIDTRYFRAMGWMSVGGGLNVFLFAAIGAQPTLFAGALAVVVGAAFIGMTHLRSWKV